MVILLKRNNIYMVLLILILSAFLYFLNSDGKIEHAASAGDNGAPKTIVLDAGHGEMDPGAISPYDSKEEKDVNLKIVMLLKDKLETGGYKVILTRTDDLLHYPIGTETILAKRKADLNYRKSIMDGADVDAVISVHLNKFDDTRYRGAQIFFAPKSPESEQLAKLIQMNIRETVDRSNTREALVNNRGIVILKNLKNPTVVAECGFVSNREEDALLAQDEYLGKLAEAIKSGIDAYFGI